MRKIGIIGAGMIGGTQADLVKHLGPRAVAMTPAAAARWADIVLLADGGRRQQPGTALYNRS